MIVWNSPFAPELVPCPVEGPALGLCFFDFFSDECFDFFSAGWTSSPPASVTAACFRFFERD